MLLLYIALLATISFAIGFDTARRMMINKIKQFHNEIIENDEGDGFGLCRLVTIRNLIERIK